MEKQTEKQIQADVIFTNDEYLKTRYATHADGSYTIRVGRGDRRDVLACKELYGKAVKTAFPSAGRRDRGDGTGRGTDHGTGRNYKRRRKRTVH